MLSPLAFGSKFEISSELFESKRISNNFTRHLKLSPDGNFVLLSTEQNIVNIFALPTSFVNENRYYKDTSIEEKGTSEWSCVHSIENGESVYDVGWYPHMNYTDPQTCCYLMTSKDRPIHLFDMNSKSIRASYNGM